MTPRATLSACLIVRDEQSRLGECLASLGCCDEIVVVDSGSRDRTVEIARAAGARVIDQPWLGFGAQRNVALEHARADWVLEIDADERVSEELSADIRAFLANPPTADMALLPCRHCFLGRWLGPAGGFPFYRARLFRRGVYRHNPNRTVHEGLWPHGEVHVLEGELRHRLADTWREAVRDMRNYAKLEAAQHVRAPGAGAFLRGAVTRPAAKLAYRLVVTQAWRDGWQGLAKVTLDCLGDVLVWVSRPAPLPAASAPAGASTGAHFSAQWGDRGQPMRLAIAAGPDAAARAALALRSQASAEVRCVLISDSPAAATASVSPRWLARVTPLAVLRVLDHEQFFGHIDDVNVAGVGLSTRLAVRAWTAARRYELTCR